MGDIIDTEDTWKFVILMGFILFWILWTDISVLINKKEAVFSGDATLGDWFKNIVELYWPTVLAVFLVFLFIFTNTKAGRGGYITLFLASLIAIYFTSYTIYQWSMGGSLRGIAGDSTGCWGTANSVPLCDGSGTANIRTAVTGVAEDCTVVLGTAADEIAAATTCTLNAGGGDCTVASGSGSCTYVAPVTAVSGIIAAEQQAACATAATALHTDTACPAGCGASTTAMDTPACNRVNGVCPAGCNQGEQHDSSLQATGECSIILPKSNHFMTKEYHFYRLIYYITIIIIAACASAKISGEQPYLLYTIVSLPFIAPFFTEVLTLYIDYLEKTEDEGDTRTNAYLAPELMLIQFMRGDHSGQRATTTTPPEFQDSYWLSKNMTGVAAGCTKTSTENCGVEPFINSHLFFTFAFYLVLILLLITYSQGYYGQSESNVPIYIALTFLFGFPFIMKNIFIQDCAYNDLEDNLPDGIAAVRGTKRDDETDAMVAAPVDERTSRLEEKQEWGGGCVMEKYGGLQTMACVSLIILILCKTQQKRDKIIVFIIMILLTYGLSQTFIIQKAYTTTGVV